MNKSWDDGEEKTTEKSSFSIMTALWREKHLCGIQQQPTKHTFLHKPQSRLRKKLKQKNKLASIWSRNHDRMWKSEFWFFHFDLSVSDSLSARLCSRTAVSMATGHQLVSLSYIQLFCLRIHNKRNERKSPSPKENRRRGKKINLMCIWSVYNFFSLKYNVGF